MALRWGIAGASKIAHDFCVALSSKLTESEHEVVAIASKSLTNAKEFAAQHGIANKYGSYKELAENVQVEVIYVTVLNSDHYEITKMMMEHGKNVLCEKPFAMNYDQAQELMNLAKQKRVFIMEGIWSRFFPVYRHLANSVRNDNIGNVKEIYIKHGFNGANSQRIIFKSMGGGIVLDIGCYAIQFVLFIYREAPKTVKATGKTNTDGVDLFFEAELTFSQGRKAFIKCSGLEQLENQATIISTKGAICIPNYWCPTKYLAFDQMYQWDLVEVKEPLFYTSSVGLKYEADSVAKCIRAGQLECPIVTMKDTLLIAKIQDHIRKQIGVRYECDKVQ